jgi:hypothetical protein
VPAEITTAPREYEPERHEPASQEEVFGSKKPRQQEDEEDIDVDSVFSKLKNLKVKE